MDEHANTYLSDFGVSAHHKPGQKRQTFVGSPCWMAPEVMEATVAPEMFPTTMPTYVSEVCE